MHLKTASQTTTVQICWNEGQPRSLVEKKPHFEGNAIYQRKHTLISWIDQATAKKAHCMTRKSNFEKGTTHESEHFSKFLKV